MLTCSSGFAGYQISIAARYGPKRYAKDCFSAADLGYPIWIAAEPICRCFGY